MRQRQEKGIGVNVGTLSADGGGRESVMLRTCTLTVCSMVALADVTVSNLETRVMQKFLECFFSSLICKLVQIIRLHMTFSEPVWQVNFHISVIHTLVNNERGVCCLRLGGGVYFNC